MRGGIGASISLADITGGVLSAGVVPWDRMKRESGQINGAGSVHGAAWTKALDIDLVQSYDTEFALLMIRFRGLKGAAAGLVSMQISDDGSTGSWDLGKGNNVTTEFMQRYVPATYYEEGSYFLLLHVTANGAINLALDVYSSNSSFTFAAADVYCVWRTFRQV